MINFIRQRYQAASNLISIYFTNHPLRSIAIFFSISIAILAIYATIWTGFRFLIGLGGMGSVIIKHLFYLLFLIMFFMVALSFAILYYNLSFRSKETKFLINLPIKIKKVSSGDGSSISILEKRRERALSFSNTFLYSA